MSVSADVIDACREYQRQCRRFVTPRCQFPQKSWHTRIQPPSLINFVAEQAALTLTEATAALEHLEASGLIVLSNNRELVYMPKVRL